MPNKRDMLQARFFGQYEILLDGHPVFIKSRSTQNLLAYLLLYPNISHRREKLAGQFWPDSSDSNARNNLRHSLWLIRKKIGLSAIKSIGSSDLDITYHPQAGDQLDVVVFEECPQSGASINQLLNAVSVYKGELLPGFYEDWVILERERLQAAFNHKMQNLLECLLIEKRWDEVLNWSEYWIAFGGTPEPAYQALMLADAGLGNLASAAAQYQRCINVLARDLEVEPSEKTRYVFNQIRKGNLDDLLPIASLPSLKHPVFPEFLKAGEKFTTIFVGREPEIEILNGYFQNMLRGKLQVVFVTGSAGSGKTALLHEFIRRSISEQYDLAIGVGRCNAFFGQGAPYLPFQDVITMLAGDIDTIYTDGIVTRDQAKRLRDLSPLVVQALAENGFVFQHNLLTSLAPIDQSLNSSRSDEPHDQGGEKNINQAFDSSGNKVNSRFFEQYTHVLKMISVQHPLLIILDDLQWMDPGTARLLFHLVQRLQSSRILILGAYRSEEVAIRRNESRHPLEPMVNEFQALFGKITIDLDKVNEKFGRKFIDALLDTEQNRLDIFFRNELHRLTQGHPFFTIQMLRNFQERKEILKDKQGYWIASTDLEWKTLSPQVEGVIAERIGRLTTKQLELLTTASVEGEQFTVQVLEQVHGIKRLHILHQLTRNLEKRHRLVQELGESWIGSQKLIRFRFTHALIQQYLYNQIGSTERSSLHQEIGHAMEEIYKGDTSLVAAPLARHFCEAGIKEKAIEYLLCAGDQAHSIYANQEALSYYQQALVYIKEIGDMALTAHTLMKKYLVQHSSFDFHGAQKTLEECKLLWQKLSDQNLKLPLPPAKIPYHLSILNKPNFDPSLCEDIFNQEYIKELFSGLVEWSENRTIIPLVSKFWEVLDEGTRYVFHLRNDVFWNDGEIVTADDFEFAWKRMLDPATNSLSANLLYDIRGAKDYHQGRMKNSNEIGVTSLDTFTLFVELEEPCGYFPYLLGNPSFFPIPKHIVEQVGDNWADPAHIVTNGAFQLDSKNISIGEPIHLGRNPYYFGKYTGNVERVTLSSYANEGEIYQAFVSGDLDKVEFLIPQMRKDELEHYKELGQLRLLPIPFVDAIYFVTNRPPFNDSDLRRAFILATDRERLAQEIENQIPAIGGFIPPGIPGHSPENTLPYNPIEARRILSAAGFPQGHDFPSVSLLLGLVGLQKGDNSVFSLLQEMWIENLGVTVKKCWGDISTLHSESRQDFNFFFIGWMADYPDPASFLQTNFLLEKSKWHNLAFDALLDAGRGTVDQSKRVNLYRKADRILIEESVTLPLFYGHIFEVRQPWVQGLGNLSAYNPQWRDITLLTH
ncbi:MAG: ABC transporter substrate-binding protein [Anaerolineaceae bacterium]